MLLLRVSPSCEHQNKPRAYHINFYTCIFSMICFITSTEATPRTWLGESRDSCMRVFIRHFAPLDMYGHAMITQFCVFC